MHVARNDTLRRMCMDFNITRMNENCSFWYLRERKTFLLISHVKVDVVIAFIGCTIYWKTLIIAVKRFIGNYFFVWKMPMIVIVPFEIRPAR